MDLAEISDRLEIEALLTRYTRAIDTGEWDRLDEVFTPDAQIDYTATGGIAAAYPEVKAWLAEMLPIFPRRHAHARPGRQPGRRGRGTAAAYFHNPMVLPQQDGADSSWSSAASTTTTLVRTPDGWRSPRAGRGARLEAGL